MLCDELDKYFKSNFRGNGSDQHDEMGVPRENCWLDLLKVQPNDRHLAGRVILSWFDALCCRELEIYHTFSAKSSANIPPANRNIVLSHGEICTLISSSNCFSDGVAIQRQKHDINGRHCSPFLLPSCDVMPNQDSQSIIV
jgi:hypothetical protein